MHSRTAKLNTVKKLFRLGLSTPTDRLTNISVVLGNTAIEKFESKNVVYLLSMCHGLFTAGVTDKIDVNPSSATTMSSLHGTAAS